MGGAQSTNTLYNSLSSSITQTMTQEVDASTNVMCQNIQEVNNANGCSITFGPQLCKATGVADVTTNASFSAKATQDVMNSLSQTAKATTSGLLPAPSKASNFTSNLVDVAITSVQSFNTDCSKTASALNRQSVNNCNDSEIQFAVQNSDVSVMGSCAATAAASTEAFNKVVNVVSQDATAESKGIDPFGALLMMLGFVLLIMLGPKIIASITSSWGQSNDTEEQKRQEAAKSRLSVLVMCILGYALLVWPGIMAYVLNVTPWAPGIVNYKEQFCTNGKAGYAAGQEANIDPRAFINTFAFWDSTCASLPPGTVCDTKNQSRHYQTCGIFSGVCDDPAAQNDMLTYQKAFEACGALQGLARTS